jgi:hypothetical protein
MWISEDGKLEVTVFMQSQPLNRGKVVNADRLNAVTTSLHGTKGNGAIHL